VPNKSQKIIRDIVHGYIPIQEKDLEIIDTAIFQRLRRIKQGYVQTVYPCANHTRFEHSLGVMFLGTKVIEQIKDQLITDLHVEPQRFETLYNTVRYACLLHDVGHAPFSHLGEKFYNKTEMIAALKCQLTRLNINAELSEKGAEHEICSCAIALEHFGDKLKDRIDLELFCRMITGEAYDSGDKRVENIIIKILNSDSDVDKLDYCLRDSFMTGARIVVLDVDRLISAVTIKDNHLAFSSKALSTIGNLVYGREAVYMWIVNHHIAIYTDCIFERLVQHLILKTKKRDEYFSYNSISKTLKDDYDLISFIRLNIEETDAYAQDLYNQLFNRKYYKSLWKNYYEYQNTPEHDTFTALVGKYRKNIEILENLIITKHSARFSKGDFYIVSASYKPFSPIQDLWILIDGKMEKFDKIFEKNFTRDAKTEIPFVFVRKDKKDELLSLIDSGHAL
jgi:hypothetical protein